VHFNELWNQFSEGAKLTKQNWRWQYAVYTDTTETTAQEWSSTNSRKGKQGLQPNSKVLNFFHEAANDGAQDLPAWRLFWTTGAAQSTPILDPISARVLLPSHSTLPRKQAAQAGEPQKLYITFTGAFVQQYSSFLPAPLVQRSLALTD